MRAVKAYCSPIQVLPTSFVNGVQKNMTLKNEIKLVGYLARKLSVELINTDLFMSLSRRIQIKISE
jgi:hypothetical protein